MFTQFLWLCEIARQVSAVFKWCFFPLRVKFLTVCARFENLAEEGQSKVQHIWSDSHFSVSLKPSFDTRIIQSMDNDDRKSNLSIDEIS